MIALLYTRTLQIVFVPNELAAIQEENKTLY